MDGDPVEGARTLRRIVSHACYASGFEQGDLLLAARNERELFYLMGRVEPERLEILRGFALIHHLFPTNDHPVHVVGTMYAILVEGYDPFQTN